jgi:hypothetical protein
VHAEADEHDTPPSPPPLPLGWGIFWMAQAVPFQRSARNPPTAMHAEADVHDTPAREPVPGIFWMTQAVPFQRSASGKSPALLG